MMERIAAASPRLKARIAGAFYLLTIVLGVFAFFFAGPLSAIGVAANYIAAASYVVVAVLFYFMFRPVNRGLSLLAAFDSVIGGVAIGTLSDLHLVPHINSFIFFGTYCVLIGYLILKSTFLPRILGVLIALAGFGYLTILWPPLETHLSSFIALVGLLGEGLLTVWLLLVGVDDRRWREQAGLARPTTAAAQIHAT
jgi:hypothetical protein